MYRPSYKELLFDEQKDREEQLRWIKDAVNGSAKIYREPPYSYEEELAREIMQLHTRIAELEAAQRQNWTPVSERLPDEGKPVWICTIWNEQHSGLFVNGYWTGLFRDFREGEVTHWMPLPELPEESKKWRIRYW